MKMRSFLHMSFLLCVSLLLSGCALIKPLEFQRVNSFEVGETGGANGVEILANITISNPNAFEFKVINADIDVFVEGIKLGKLEIPNEVIVNKKSEFKGDFKVTISLKNMLLAGRNIFSILKAGQINLQLKGTIKAQILWKTYDFDVNHSEDVKLHS